MSPDRKPCPPLVGVFASPAHDGAMVYVYEDGTRWIELRGDKWRQLPDVPYWPGGLDG